MDYSYLYCEEEFLDDMELVSDEGENSPLMYNNPTNKNVDPTLDSLYCHETLDDDCEDDTIGSQMCVETNDFGMYEKNPITNQQVPMNVSSTSAQEALNKYRIQLQDKIKLPAYQCMLRQELEEERHHRPYEYLKYRRVLVDWMSEVGERLRVAKPTVHIAIELTERALGVSTPHLEKDKIQLVALVCIWIAAKVEGPEDQVPRIHELYEFGNELYSKDDFVEMEAYTVHILNWYLTAVSPIHYMEFFKSQTILFEDDEIEGSDMIDEAVECYKKYADFFVDLCLQEYTFKAYRPSVIAASILACARKALDVKPLWRAELGKLTGYTADQVEPCFSNIWQHYVKTFGARHATKNEISPVTVDNVPGMSQY